jgi:hypothetical protein
VPQRQRQEPGGVHGVDEGFESDGQLLTAGLLAPRAKSVAAALQTKAQKAGIALADLRRLAAAIDFAEPLRKGGLAAGGKSSKDTGTVDLGRGMEPPLGTALNMSGKGRFGGREGVGLRNCF